MLDGLLLFLVMRLSRRLLRGSHLLSVVYKEEGRGDVPRGESRARGRFIASIGFRPDGIAIIKSAALAQ